MIYSSFTFATVKIISNMVRWVQTNILNFLNLFTGLPKIMYKKFFKTNITLVWLGDAVSYPLKYLTDVFKATLSSFHPGWHPTGWKQNCHLFEYREVQPMLVGKGNSISIPLLQVDEPEKRIWNKRKKRWNAPNVLKMWSCRAAQKTMILLSSVDWEYIFGHQSV